MSTLSDPAAAPDFSLSEALKDKMGRYRTLSLFWEERHDDYPPVFTLKRRDHEGCVSMYLKYMEIGDPTEYRFALRCLGSWEHWLLLSTRAWFTPYLESWREELRTRIESERYHEMVELSTSAAGTPSGVSATKWLSAHYGKTGSTSKAKRGRPSKDEVQSALNADKYLLQEAEEDAKRLGLGTS